MGLAKLLNIFYSLSFSLLVSVVIQVEGWGVIDNGWGHHHLLSRGQGGRREGEMLTGLQLVLVWQRGGGF